MHIYIVKANYQNWVVFGSDRTIPHPESEEKFVIISMRVQLSWPMISFSILYACVCTPFVARVWVWPVVWLHWERNGTSYFLKKNIYIICIHHTFWWEPIYLCKSWIISLLKRLTSASWEFNVVEAICSWRMSLLHFLGARFLRIHNDTIQT